MSEFEPGNSENFQDKKNSPPEIKNERKIYAFVGLIGIVALFFGFLRLSQYVKSPFMPEAVPSNTSSFLTQVQIDQIDALKNKDTDTDGLSDYDELYFHRTSPYLADSDSDGLTDKQEIDSGTDPNCPEGQACVSYGADTNTSLANASTTDNSSVSATNSTLLSGNATADTLRETLKNAGVPQNVLDGMSDEELMEVYNQTVQDTQTNANSNISPAADINISPNANISDEEATSILRTLTPAEIRQLLIESGVAESELSGLDDETLQAIFLKALEDQGTANTNTSQ
ncbi:MAG: thrombospondin type 3 repeat-containing protein [Patescibacteria group bacterium]